MSVERALALIADAQASLAKAQSELYVPPIATPSEFDAAYAKASKGDTLTLAAGFAYDRPLTVDKGVTIRGESATSGRMTKEEALPCFLGGLRVTGDDVTLAQVSVRSQNQSADIVVLTGSRVVLDRCRIQGHPANGAKRGVAANGSEMAIRECWIGDVFRAGQDTQAVCSWDMGGGLVIDDCYLAGAGQSVMLGGADSSSEARMPHDVLVQYSTLTKDPAWYGMGMQVKCALELKACRNVLVHDCVLEHGGTSQGQGAYLIVATVRNQGGAAPWSAIQETAIRECTGGKASGIVNILGSDNNHPDATGFVDGLIISDCAFEGIDPKANPLALGSGRLFMFDRAARHVTLANLTVQGQNLKALGYFAGPPPTGLVVQGMSLPPAQYGWKIDGGGMGRDALLKYAPDALLDGTVA